MTTSMPEHDPLVKRTVVPLDAASAFVLFTRDIGTWWPLGTHSIAADTYDGRVETVGLVFEERDGGQIYEKMSDGSKAAWGRVVVWDPPSRVVFSWKPNLSDGPFTEVEVRFRPTDGGTEVELEHRGWERFGTEAGERRGEYDAGWPGVLELFREHATT